MTGRLGEFGNDGLRALGQRLRQLREQRQWSLKRLARESDISVAAIRKIELGQSNPSLPTILSVVEALGESIDHLVSAARESEVLITVTRKAANPLAGTRDTDRTGDLAEPEMRCSVVTASEGGFIADPDSRGAAFGYVLDGGLSVQEGSDGHELCETGDSFHLSSLGRFQMHDASGKGAHLLLVRDLTGGAADDRPATRPDAEFDRHG